MIDNEKERQEFAGIMMALAEEYGGKILAPHIRIRFEALRAYSIRQIGEATTWLLKNRTTTFPLIPTVREIIDAVERRCNPQLSIQSAAELQVDVVIECVRRYGRDAKPKFDDPITDKLMTTRWPYKSWAANLQDSEVKWWRREFIEAYEAYNESNAVQRLALEGGQMAENVFLFIANRQKNGQQRQLPG